MRNFLFYFTIIISLFLNSLAEAKNYSSAQITTYVNKIPREQENKLDTLVKYLIAPFDNDYDKAKAIAFWIASRINYDEYLYSNGKTSKLLKTYTGQSPKELINSRVGICEDFSNLFKELCRRAKIRASVITGYAYPAGISLSANKRRNSGHAWNAFIYNNKKIFVDTTFMARGTMKVEHSQNNMNRRRALKDVKRENKTKSQINDFDEFYFDFTYKDEKSKRKYIHKEQ